MGLEYAYTNARVKGMKSNLLGASVLREMMAVKTADEVIAILEQSPYSQDFVRLSQNYSGLELVDKALHENFVRTVRTVFRSLPKSGRKAFEVLASEWLAADIKKILSKKALGEKVDESELIVVNEKNRQFFKRLIAAPSLEQTIAVLASKDFGGNEFKNALAGESDFRVAIREIDKALARQLNAYASSLDKLSAGIIRKKMEYHDALVALRLKKEGLKLSEIAKFLLAPECSLSKKIAGAHSLETALDVVQESFSIEKNLVENAKQSGNLVLVEVALEKALAKAVVSATRISVLSFATVLGFFYLKQIEVENIRKIAFANAFGLREEMSQYVFALNE